MLHAEETSNKSAEILDEFVEMPASVQTSDNFFEALEKPVGAPEKPVGTPAQPIRNT